MSFNCQATPGNPNSTTFYWTKIDNQEFRQSGSTLHLPNIQRTNSGTYRCTTENSYSNGEKGTHSQSIIVNVQCEISIYFYIHAILKYRSMCVFIKCLTKDQSLFGFIYTK